MFTDANQHSNARVTASASVAILSHANTLDNAIDSAKKTATSASRPARLLVI